MSSKKTEYVIAEMNLSTPLTTGAKYFKQGAGFTIEECTESRGGYWITDHRGPKWWVPGTSVGSCKYDPVEAKPSKDAAA